MPSVAVLLSDAVARLRSSGSETARLDAEVLLGFVLGVDRTAVVAHPDADVGDHAAATFGDLVRRREAGEPVAYIRGLKEFFGLALAVDPRVLIPRPETERLVELAEAEVLRGLVEAPRSLDAQPIQVVDVGTGSGAVVIALAVALRRRGMLDEVRMLATDVAEDVLELARENAVGHAVADRIEFTAGDLLPDYPVRQWDLVLANLPYVRTDVIPELPRAASFEPRLALDGGADGLTVIARLLDRLPTALASDGVALLEIGGDQGADILGAVHDQLPGWQCRIELDLAGLPRVARVERARQAGREGW